MQAARNKDDVLFIRIFNLTEHLATLEWKSIWYAIAEKDNVKLAPYVMDAVMLHKGDVVIIDLLITAIELFAEKCVGLIEEMRVDLNRVGNYLLTPLQAAVMIGDES